VKPPRDGGAEMDYSTDMLALSYDYTKGKLNELIDIIIESGAKLFVSAVGVPPKHVVERYVHTGLWMAL
jgi:hypothetical protein